MKDRSISLAVRRLCFFRLLFFDDCWTDYCTFSSSCSSHSTPCLTFLRGAVFCLERASLLSFSSSLEDSSLFSLPEGESFLLSSLIGVYSSSRVGFWRVDVLVYSSSLVTDFFWGVRCLFLDFCGVCLTGDAFSSGFSFSFSFFYLPWMILFKY